ncbi:LSm family protein [Treponema pectinovorum]|uniref:ribosome maturation factor n=1 Tax=Treponema pectinovorum TaxID=164 RepID=UPI0011C78B07|nr:ribosome maturation factor [Treponema pectinovorum]
MEYIALDSQPHYAECEEIASSLGYHLVELKISKQSSTTRILAVITGEDSTANIGINDCSKVHHALLPKIEEILGTDDTYMELTSPGMERNIKNAAEFALFKGRQVRVWDKTISDWVGGKVISADKASVTLEVAQEDGSFVQKTVSYADIAKAKFIHL